MPVAEPDSLPRWTEALDARVAAGLTPGMVAAVERNGNTQIHAAGFRDIDQALPVEADTIFRLASVSKPISAAGAMLLVDDGLIALDEPLDRWLPELSSRRPTGAPEGVVSLRGLLAMTFGIGVDFAGCSPINEQLRGVGIGTNGFEGTSDELMGRLAAIPFACRPGERWLYHTGIDIAGILIERVLHTSLDHFLAERLFKPLGMRDTGFQLDPEQNSRLATPYIEQGQGRYLAFEDSRPRAQRSRMDQAGSGLLSTAHDLAAFGRMLLNEGISGNRQILSTSAIAEMTREQVTPEAKARSPVFPGFWESHGWGLGLCIATSPNAVSKRPGRFGWWGALGTALFMDPAIDKVIVVLSNRLISSLSDSANADAVIGAALLG